ncbi:GMP synthase [candidate division KSB1 bacterium]|nr:GMP synthase [candidate division KSB1 bacterium]
MKENNHPICVAILDLYDNLPNQGMRCIKEIVSAHDKKVNGHPVTYDVYDTRAKAEVPDLSYDIYISSGGPGSPYDGEGKEWETKYFHWWESVWKYNQNHHANKKYVFAICHSFQMMCRYFDLAAVTMRQSKSFGVMPVHKTPAGEQEWLYAGLPDPFFAADFRDWQVVQPNQRVFQQLGAEILSLEKIRPHISKERSIMAIRLSPEIVGVQYHPEADPEAMRVHAIKPERKQDIINRFGLEKYNELMQRLDDPSLLWRTREAIMPRFLVGAIKKLRPETNGNGSGDARMRT